MSIDDTSLPDLLELLAGEMRTLHRMQDWAAEHGNYTGTGLAITWAYGQYDHGFKDIILGVEAIARERIAEIIQEAVRRKEEQTIDLHRRIQNRIGAKAEERAA